MFQPKTIKGAKALLFERLADGPQAGGQPLRVYDANHLKDSVRKEIMRLLRTRCPGIRWPADERDRTVLDYGIPDFSWMSAVNGSDLEQLAQTLTQAIKAYEPRLLNVTVTVGPSGQSQSEVVSTNSGDLPVGSLTEPVTFEILLGLKSGRADLIVAGPQVL
jgi:type VI secretion system protein ImpF